MAQNMILILKTGPSGNSKDIQDIKLFKICLTVYSRFSNVPAALNFWSTFLNLVEVFGLTPKRGSYTLFNLFVDSVGWQSSFILCTYKESITSFAV